MTCQCYLGPILRVNPTNGKRYCLGCGRYEVRIEDIRPAGSARRDEGWDGGLLAKLIGPCSPPEPETEPESCWCYCHTRISRECSNCRCYPQAPRSVFWIPNIKI